MPQFHYSQSARRAMVLVALSTLALSACAVRQKTVVAPPAPVPAPAAPMPQPPAGAALVQSIPALGPDGRYMTPSYGLTPAEALWHVRVALNVAALGCRNDPADAHRLNYNRFLAMHKATLARTNAAVDAHYRQRFGGTALALRDTRTTQAYNFFALPPAQDGFCNAAAMVGANLIAVPSDQLASLAPAALQQLEQPFADFYTAFASYRKDLARWQAARYASASNAPVTAFRMVETPTPIQQPVVYAKPQVRTSAPATYSKPATPAQRPGPYVVQLGAYDSQEAARSAWLAIVGENPEYKVSQLVTSATTVNGRRFHRVSISGFSTQADAVRMCSTLKAKGANCFARKVAPDDSTVRWSSI